MSINISQAFKRTSANPVDESLALTKAQMLTVNDNLMPSKYFTVCQDDGKIYLYDKTNTVDPATGKFRVFEGGGSGGATNLADLEDVLLTALADGQTLVWDDTEQKWVNADMPTVPTKVSELENDSKFVDEDALNDALGAKQDTLTAGDGIVIENDEISIDPMPAEDMDDVIDELPTGGNIAVTGYVPLGTLIPYYGETAPKFFLACDGSTYNKADYPELANHLLSLTNNTPYIVDGDNTKFKVPDLRGEFIRGTGSNSHDNNYTGVKEGNGSDVGVHQPATVEQSLNQYNGQLYFGKDTSLTISTPAFMDSQSKSNTYQYLSNGTSGTQADRTLIHTARPTNTSVLFCIAYKDIYSNPMNDYSTDEKVVGTWIDGKTLYQKTIIGIQMPSVITDGESVSVNYTFSDLGISNIQEVTDYNIAVIHPSHHVYKQNHFSYDNTTKTTTMLFNVWVTYSSNEYKLSARNVMTSNNGSTIRITIQYTKTT